MIEKKTPLLQYFVCFQMQWLQLKWVRNYLFLKNYVLQRVTFLTVLYTSHNGNVDSIGQRSCKIIMKEKAPCLHTFCFFSDA